MNNLKGIIINEFRMRGLILKGYFLLNFLKAKIKVKLIFPIFVETLQDIFTTYFLRLLTKWKCVPS